MSDDATSPDVDALAEVLKVGDRVRFHPKPGRAWWVVRARDDRYIICTRQAPFQPKGEPEYTILDLVGYQDHTRNGAGNGVVRSSLNTLGGGWDVGSDGEHCSEMLADLQSGEWELSTRRLLDVRRVEVAS